VNAFAIQFLTNDLPETVEYIKNSYHRVQQERKKQEAMFIKPNDIEQKNSSHSTITKLEDKANASEDLKTQEIVENLYKFRI